jgi:zinc protease
VPTSTRGPRSTIPSTSSRSRPTTRRSSARGSTSCTTGPANVSYGPAEVDKERGVVKEEWRLGRGAGERIFDKQAPVLFQGSRYAVRLPIGVPEILDKAPRDKLYKFYKDWYRPDLMAVIAVGDFDDVGAIEHEIRARFGDLKNPAGERPRVAAGVPRRWRPRSRACSPRSSASSSTA